MSFHSGAMHNDDTDALFAAYLRMPMVPWDDSPLCSGVRRPV